MNELIINIVNVCIVPILTILTAYAVSAIKVRINTLKSKEARDFFTQSMDEFEKAVNTAVNSVSQTYVDSLKANGFFDAEEQKKALSKAKDTALHILSADTINFLNERLTSDGFTKLLEAKIEEAVQINKLLK